MYKYYLIALLGMGVSPVVFGMTSHGESSLSELPTEIQVHIAKFVADAPNLETAVKNVKGLLSTSRQLSQFTPDIIDYLSKQSYLDQEPIILNVKSTYDFPGMPWLKEAYEKGIYSNYKKILVALALDTPEAHAWLRKFAQEHPQVLGQYLNDRLGTSGLDKMNFPEAAKIQKIVSGWVDINTLLNPKA